ncbi:hypothetical protein SDC9_101460 [bioreactor metagenome]|uniref:Uncharacterized protein n=1 Tax=bioreactor metagenome TaxID=1076179 RepID=A0A645AQT3_9ZZZZ
MHVGGDLPPQLGHAGIGGILGKALLQGIYARVSDVPGGDEIRLADAQRNSVLHFLQNVKKPADTRGRNLLNPPRQYGLVIHTKINSLS